MWGIGTLLHVTRNLEIVCNRAASPTCGFQKHYHKSQGSLRPGWFTLFSTEMLLMCLSMHDCILFHKFHTSHKHFFKIQHSGAMKIDVQATCFACWQFAILTITVNQLLGDVYVASLTLHSIAQHASQLRTDNTRLDTGTALCCQQSYMAIIGMA